MTKNERVATKMLAKRQTKNIIKRPGRPTDYSNLIVSEICEQLSEGKSLRSICKAKKLPSCSTIFLWLSKYPEFSEQYAHAREAQADLLADEIISIADEPVLFAEQVARNRLRVDARKWMAGKLRPKRYGDKVEHEHGGLGGENIQLTVNFVDPVPQPADER